jgi:hypothetical protein
LKNDKTVGRVSKLATCQKHSFFKVGVPCHANRERVPQERIGGPAVGRSTEVVHGVIKAQIKVTIEALMIYLGKTT